MRIVGPAILPLRWGSAVTRFTLWHFDFDGDRWVAAYTGNIHTTPPVQLRIESACIFGHVLRSAQCDCGFQLEAAMRQFAQCGRGLLLYGVDQDARGLGTAAHFAIYQMRQQEGLDTPEVFDRLNAKLDNRSYAPVIAILQHLRINSVVLLTNNPGRAVFLRDHGIQVSTEGLEAQLDVYNMSTLMLEKEDLGYEWSFETHADWLEPMQAEVLGQLDLSLACAVVPGKGAVSDPVASVRSDTWSTARDLADVFPTEREIGPLVVYLTDFPRVDEMSLYARLGAAVLVVPFARIPMVLLRAADQVGIRIVDWARRNAYPTDRPQWTLVGWVDGLHIYRRGDRVRLLALGEPAQASTRLAAAERALAEAGGLSVTELVRGDSWIEGDAGLLAGAGGSAVGNVRLITDNGSVAEALATLGTAQ